MRTRRWQQAAGPLALVWFIAFLKSLLLMWARRMVGLMTISQIGEGSYKEMKKHLQQVCAYVGIALACRLAVWGLTNT
jgi:hypothetical protein